MTAILYDADNRRITEGAKKITLTPIENSIFLVLARRNGSMVRTEIIASVVWSDTAVGPENAFKYISVIIHRIRAKLRDRDMTDCIASDRRAGYSVQNVTLVDCYTLSLDPNTVRLLKRVISVARETRPILAEEAHDALFPRVQDYKDDSE